MAACDVAGGDVCWFVGADSEKQILFTWSGGAVVPGDWSASAVVLDRVGGTVRHAFAATVATTPQGGAVIKIPASAATTSGWSWRGGILRVTAKHTPSGDTYAVFSGRAVLR